MSYDEKPLTPDEVQQHFEGIIRRLHESKYARLQTEEEIADFVAAMDMFSTYHDRLLQNYYESLEYFEWSAAKTDSKLESARTQRHAKVWKYLKEIPLVKKRWYKRKKALRKGI